MFEPNVAKIVASFAKIHDKLQAAMDYHVEKAAEAHAALDVHNAEADKADKLVQKFKEFM